MTVACGDGIAKSFAMVLAPPDELVARFRADVEALTGAAPGRLGLGVSGGPDSMAMLLLAAAAYPGAVIAATVDHGLRPEARDEAVVVAGVCAQLGAAHAILAPPEDFDFAGNVQERARLLRYAALAKWAEAEGAAWVAVAHQRDDLAETFLMRARRGSGVGGLAAMRGIRPLGERVQLIRPLLGWSREELGGVLCRLGLEAAHDRSNADPRYDRSRMRALIAGSGELVPSRLALSAQNLRHAEELIDWTVRREMEGRLLVRDGEVQLVVEDAPYELRRRLARIAVDTVRREHGQRADWHAQGLDRLIAALAAGGTGTIAGVQARARSGKWHFRLAPPRRSH